jgi:F0F1-type ATP synthase assembly protein I
MKKKRAENKTVSVGGNLTGNAVSGNRNRVSNTTINNQIDSEELGYSLGETLNKSANQARREEWIRESQSEDSRQVMETVLVSLISGLAIGLCWKFAFPWNVETVPFFVIGTTILFNVLRITNFGLRRSMFKVILIGTAFLLLLRYTLFIQAWMDINQFAGTTILATLGAIIGLFVGFIQTFWHPLED